MNKQKPHRNVSQMVRKLSDDKAFSDEFEELVSQRQIVKHLFALRNSEGLSQSDIAKRLGCTQSRISKLENGIDTDLKLGDLCAYVSALGLNLNITLQPDEATLVDEIKYHALTIKERLDLLAELARDDEETAQGVAAFFGEAFLNLVRIIQDSVKRLPRRTDESPYIRLEMIMAPDKDDKDKEQPNTTAKRMRGRTEKRTQSRVEA